ncbi:23436_t:CDS:2, partial [Dentiscutata erythropus]
GEEIICVVKAKTNNFEHGFTQNLVQLQSACEAESIRINLQQLRKIVISMLAKNQLKHLSLDQGMPDPG